LKSLSIVKETLAVKLFIISLIILSFNSWAQECPNPTPGLDPILGLTEGVCSATSAMNAGNVEIEMDPLQKEKAIQIIAEDIKKNENRTEPLSVIIAEIKDQVHPINLKLDHEPKNSGKKRVPGSLSVTWGYHKGWMTKSNVRMSHPDGSYDFVSKGVKAYDRPALEAAIPKKGQPYRFDVPQYQLSFRYTFPSDDEKKLRHGIKLQQIHSKYLPVPNEEDRFTKGQDVWTTGKYVDGSTNEGIKKIGTYGTSYWEYTDGLNEATIGYFVEKELVKYKALSVSGTVGLNGGVVIPATYSVINGKVRDHFFDISGMVVSTDGALKLTLWNKLFVEVIGTASFVDVTNGRMADGGKIQQQFGHFKCGANIGYKIKIGGGKKQ
jgi:hypothetical protein